MSFRQEQGSGDGPVSEIPAGYPSLIGSEECERIGPDEYLRSEDGDGSGSSEFALFERLLAYDCY
jgi:hypothetical protein